ncbi:unnamed protein product [Brachionus calyciflorus]|uniref:Uncharacterized protein n=1 Tax=Brachionus calyciflorus TaxID=104777 RepID=A0A814RCS2_9BILA|nr:unnamed protein product [Brachionus calyciflorus]
MKKTRDLKQEKINFFENKINQIETLLKDKDVELSKLNSKLEDYIEGYEKKLTDSDQLTSSNKNLKFNRKNPKRK